jgi:hypothetical protein
MASVRVKQKARLQKALTIASSIQGMNASMRHDTELWMGVLISQG